MNLLSHRFSQNVSQNFCPVVWQVQGRNPYNIWFIFWEERWLLKFNLKFTDLYARTSLGYGQITSPNLILWIILMGWTPGALFRCIFLTLTFYNLKSNPIKIQKIYQMSGLISVHPIMNGQYWMFWPFLKWSLSLLYVLLTFLFEI